MLKETLGNEKPVNRKSERIIILASSNYNRKRCFEAAHVTFQVIPNNLDEKTVDNKDPFKKVELTALKKASIVRDLWISELQKQEGPAIIIGANTMIILNENHYIGKPKDKQEAFEILSLLSGKTHEVLTGVAIMATDSNKVMSYVDSTKVHFLPLTSEDIRSYINNTSINNVTINNANINNSNRNNSGFNNSNSNNANITSANEYFDRVGGYAIDGLASLFIDKIEGSPTNVLGISMAWIWKSLREFGIDLLKDSKKP
jgi:septum formation protein